MKRFGVLGILLLLAADVLMAQEREQNFFQRVDSFFGLSSTKNIDTTSYVLEPCGWMFNINNNFAMMNVSSSFGESDIKAMSQFNYAIGVTAGYRNLILGYTFLRPVGNARDMTLAINANAWGVEFRKYINDDFNGTARLKGGSSIDISSGDIEVESRYLRAYHTFNARRYSTTAALDHRCIQRRSAGSVLFYTDFARHALSFSNVAIPAAYSDGIEKITYTSAALGLGYGYNLAFFDGRLLFHAMAVPMFAVIFDEAFSRYDVLETDRGTRFRMGLIARLAANYRINDYFGINLMAVYNRTAMSGRIEECNMAWNDLLVRASLCCRF